MIDIGQLYLPTPIINHRLLSLQQRVGSLEYAGLPTLMQEYTIF